MINKILEHPLLLSYTTRLTWCVPQSVLHLRSSRQHQQQQQQLTSKWKESCHEYWAGCAWLSMDELHPLDTTWRNGRSHTSRTRRYRTAGTVSVCLLSCISALEMHCSADCLMRTQRLQRMQERATLLFDSAMTFYYYHGQLIKRYEMRHMWGLTELVSLLGKIQNIYAKPTFLRWYWRWSLPECLSSSAVRPCPNWGDGTGINVILLIARDSQYPMLRARFLHQIYHAYHDRVLNPAPRRTRESNMSASHGVALSSEAQWKWRPPSRGASGRIPAPSRVGRTTGPSRPQRRWGGARAYTLGLERWWTMPEQVEVRGNADGGP